MSGVSEVDIYGGFEPEVRIDADPSRLAQYDLTLEVHIEAAENAYLSGDFSLSKDLSDTVLLEARHLLDKLKSGRIACLAGALMLWGCASNVVPPPPQRVIGEDVPYLIGVPDLLEVRVWRQPELTVNVQVRADGKITVPLVDDVQAEGLAPERINFQTIR